MKIKDKLDKFQEWLEKCPIEYDEHLQTSDDDITSINFHYKNIWNRNLIKEDEWKQQHHIEDYKKGYKNLKR